MLLYNYSKNELCNYSKNESLKKLFSNEKMKRKSEEIPRVLLSFQNVCDVVSIRKFYFLFYLFIYFEKKITHLL